MQENKCVDCINSKFYATAQCKSLPFCRKCVLDYWKKGEGSDLIKKFHEERGETVSFDRD